MLTLICSIFDVQGSACLCLCAREHCSLTKPLHCSLTKPLYCSLAKPRHCSLTKPLY